MALLLILLLPILYLIIRNVFTSIIIWSIIMILFSSINEPLLGITTIGEVLNVSLIIIIFIMIFLFNLFRFSGNDYKLEKIMDSLIIDKRVVPYFLLATAGILAYISNIIIAIFVILILANIFRIPKTLTIITVVLTVPLFSILNTEGFVLDKILLNIQENLQIQDFLNNNLINMDLFISNISTAIIFTLIIIIFMTFLIIGYMTSYYYFETRSLWIELRKHYKIYLVLPIVFLVSSIIGFYVVNNLLGIVIGLIITLIYSIVISRGSHEPFTYDFIDKIQFHKKINKKPSILKAVFDLIIVILLFGVSFRLENLNLIFFVIVALVIILYLIKSYRFVKSEVVTILKDSSIIVLKIAILLILTNYIAQIVALNLSEINFSDNLLTVFITMPIINLLIATFSNIQIEEYLSLIFSANVFVISFMFLTYYVTKGANLVLIYIIGKLIKASREEIFYAVRGLWFIILVLVAVIVIIIFLLNIL